jgi:hypothetical protein
VTSVLLPTSVLIPESGFLVIFFFFMIFMSSYKSILFHRIDKRTKGSHKSIHLLVTLMGASGRQLQQGGEIVGFRCYLDVNLSCI